MLCAMYSQLTSSQALFLATRVSSQPNRFLKNFHTRSQYLPSGYTPKAPLNPFVIHFSRNCHRTYKSCNFSEPSSFSNRFFCKSLEMGSLAKPRSISSAFRVKNAVQYCGLIRVKSFLSLSSVRVGKASRVLRAGRLHPSLKSSKAKDAKGGKKETSTKTSCSSWEESAKRLEKVSDTHSSWKESVEGLERGTITEIDYSSLNESAENFSGNEESRKRLVSRPTSHQSVYFKSHENMEEEGEEVEIVDGSRWNKFNNRFRRDEKVRSEKPDSQRWTRQENFGRKTWKEATVSTVPKMVGEGLYGVGPVLAALSAKRREFYALYVQEGLSLSSNNRKRKDKKGFEKVLQMAENIGISIKEASKHDLNMIVYNRPHQGLVLDVSPLEMVKIKELDPISTEEEQASLWVALDEVTDPQNLGAIIRSAYFFGASGVVLCAKNSAPLSGVVSKSSAGSLELMELRYCNNMMQFLVSSAENGWRVLGGSVSSKAIALNEVPTGPPTILVLGSEGTGLRPLVERSCTHLVRISGNIPIDVTAEEVDDMTPDVHYGPSAEQFRSFMAVESLNVSVAAGVLLHHLIGHHYKSNGLVGDNSTDSVD